MKYPSMLPTLTFGSSGESLVNGNLTTEPWAPSTADPSAHAFGGSMSSMRSFIYGPASVRSRDRIPWNNTTSGICQRASRGEERLLVLPVVHDQPEEEHRGHINGTKSRESERVPGLE